MSKGKFDPKVIAGGNQAESTPTEAATADQPAAEQETPAEPKKYYSRHKNLMGAPAFFTYDEEERDRLDKSYRVIVSDVMLGAGSGGMGHVGAGGIPREFPLDVEIELYGFQIRTLRDCVFDSDEVVYDKATGNLKLTGRKIQKQRFRVEVLDGNI